MDGGKLLRGSLQEKLRRFCPRDLESHVFSSVLRELTQSLESSPGFGSREAVRVRRTQRCELGAVWAYIYVHRSTAGPQRVAISRLAGGNSTRGCVCSGYRVEIASELTEKSVTSAGIHGCLLRHFASSVHPSPGFCPGYCSRRAPLRSGEPEAGDPEAGDPRALRRAAASAKKQDGLQ